MTGAIRGASTWPFSCVAVTEPAAPVAVIGMHRSGTSCLAGCLEDLGLTLGPVNTRAGEHGVMNRPEARIFPVALQIVRRAGP